MTVGNRRMPPDVAVRRAGTPRDTGSGGGWKELLLSLIPKIVDKLLSRPPKSEDPTPSIKLCTREPNHSGPCNGYPTPQCYGQGEDVGRV